jgi:MFS family permease
VLYTGSSIGGVIFPIMVTRLIASLGFPWAMRCCAFLILLLLIIANLTVRPFYKPARHAIRLAQFIQPYKELDFVLIVIGFLFYTFGYFIPFNYLTVNALEAGVEPYLVQYLIPILNSTSLFGRLSAGIAGDRLGVYEVFIAVAYVTSILILALWIPATTTAIIIAFAALFGFFSGAYVSLISPLIVQASPLPEIGLRSGLVFLVGAIPTLTGNPIGGALLATPHGWLGPKLFSGLMCIVGATCILFARLNRRKPTH